jgi:hypothetical protein
MLSDDAVETQREALREFQSDSDLDRAIQKRFHGQDRSGIVAIRKDLSALVDSVTPFAWSEQAITQAGAAADSFPLDGLIRLSDLYTPAMWWHFERPILVRHPDVDSTASRPLRSDGVMVIDGQLMRSPGWLFVVSFFRAEDPPAGGTHRPLLALTTARWRPDEESFTQATLLPLVPTDRHRAAVIDVDWPLYQVVLRFVASSVLWLHSKVSATTPMACSRGVRRRIERQIGHALAPVSVITLRATEFTAAADRDGSSREYACRWPVRMHWRQQPYKTGVRPKLIASYVKGPKDKPFRVPTHRVNVTR